MKCVRSVLCWNVLPLITWSCSVDAQTGRSSEIESERVRQTSTIASGSRRSTAFDKLPHPVVYIRRDHVRTTERRRHPNHGGSWSPAGLV